VGLITVYRPDTPSEAIVAGDLAVRRLVPDGAVLTLINNGKVNSRQLLELLAECLRELLPIQSVELYTKPSAGLVLGAEEARRVAARSHLIVAGVGD
jgi:hypothetical protein